MTSKQLKEARSDLGLTQQALADLLLISRRTYEKYEVGQNPVTGPVSTAVWLMLHYKGAVNALMRRGTKKELM